MTKKETEYTPEEGFNVDNFSLEEDFIPDPLIPQGTYKGNVVGVTYDNAKCYISFEVCLDGNGGVKSDGETLIDGSRLTNFVFLPKPGDENERTKNGKNKRQNKINMLKEFAEGMKINMNTPADIKEALDNNEWIGLAVQVTVESDEYQGRVRDKIKLGTMKADV